MLVSRTLKRGEAEAKEILQQAKEKEDIEKRERLIEEKRKELADYQLQEDDGKALAADSVNLGSIFVFFLKETTRIFLENVWHYIAFPAAALFSGLRAVYAWRESKAEQHKNSPVYQKALVEIATAIAIGATVFFSFVIETFAKTIAPIIFTIVLAAKALFHFGRACIHFAKGWALDNKIEDSCTLLAELKNRQREILHKINQGVASEAEQKKYDDLPNLILQQEASIALQKKLAAKEWADFKMNGIAFFAGALATIAVGFVMIAAKPAVALFGVISATIGTVMGINKFRKAQAKQKALRQEALEAGIAAAIEQPTEGCVPNLAKKVRSGCAELYQRVVVKAPAKAAQPMPLAAVTEEAKPEMPDGAEQKAEKEPSCDPVGALARCFPVAFTPY